MIIKHETIGDIDIVGNCPSPDCKGDIAGESIQLQQGDDAITIPLDDLLKIRDAMIRVMNV